MTVKKHSVKDETYNQSKNLEMLIQYSLDESRQALVTGY